ncbi:MAG: FMN-dependent NADH-azoreductase [Anaerofustis sp.]|jgi:FMN-dependent NADH-azoreductase
MSKVLYIKANSKPEELSRTFRISNKFIEAYKKEHPQDEIQVIDLYKENLIFLPESSVLAHAMAATDAQNDPILKYAYQFLEADKYVFAEPLWNLGIPAVLKAYIDYISVSGVTFRYTAEGPVGMCQNKPAVNITGRGGTYSSGPMAEYEMGDRYLRTICRFLGICNFTTITAENLDVIGSDVDAIVGKAIAEAEALAKKF